MTLDVVTVREVLDRTWPYRANWRFIGIQLGMDPYELAAIHHTYIMVSVGECLREMIDKWLSHHDPKPTRLALDKALQSKSVLDITGIIQMAIHQFNVYCLLTPTCTYYGVFEGVRSNFAGNIPYFRVIRRISLISTYSLICAYWPKCSLLGAFCV